MRCFSRTTFAVVLFQLSHVHAQLGGFLRGAQRRMQGFYPYDFVDPGYESMDMEIEEDKYAMPEVTYEEYGDNMYKMEDLDYEVTEDVKEGELMTMSELDYVNMNEYDLDDYEE